MSRWLISMLSVVAIASGVPARAQDKPDGAALETVISAQIEAIGRDDAATAQSFAAPGIKRIFPDAGQFLAMVKQSYAPLVHPKSTHFAAPEDSGLGPMEKVMIVDSNGVVWTALYTFEQVDGQWRITGCSLMKAPDTSA